MSAPDFKARFDAFAGEARLVKAEAIARIVPLLAEADAILDELRGQGVSVRPEMPIGRAGKLSEMRFVAGFEVKL